jgi:predicted N-acyltransferase
MSDSPESAFDIKTTHSVAEVGQAEWDALSGNRPFQSYRWYTYGERCMADCPPFYIILTLNNQAVARGTFWLVRDEPLPINPPLRTLVQAVFRRWPLLICRSPLAGLSGLILPDPPLRDEALIVIAQSALEELRHLGGSFVVFDYLEPDQVAWPGWPGGFSAITIADPGTKLNPTWSSFEDYLVSNKWRIRQHYKRSSRQASDLGIIVTRHEHVEDVDTALQLIRNVERKHEASPSPWARAMLEQMEFMESTWLTAHIGNQLVGCLLLLYDNGVQIAKLPGLAENVPFAYFILLYEALREAFEKKLASLLWGSGSYDLKRRLGFELENNNNAVLTGRGFCTRLAAKLAG